MNLSYDTHYYCPKCCLPIPKEKAEDLRCPFCRNVLRTRPRRLRHKEKLKLPRIDPENYGVIC